MGQSPSAKEALIARQSLKSISLLSLPNHSSGRLLAQTTLRNILGTKNLHEILSDRESISSAMQVRPK